MEMMSGLRPMTIEEFVEFYFGGKVYEASVEAPYARSVDGWTDFYFPLHYERQKRMEAVVRMSAQEIVRMGAASASDTLDAMCMIRRHLIGSHEFPVPENDSLLDEVMRRDDLNNGFIRWRRGQKEMFQPATNDVALFRLSSGKVVWMEHSSKLQPALMSKRRAICRARRYIRGERKTAVSIEPVYPQTYQQDIPAHVDQPS